jgi:hypothetical protein
MLYALVIKGQAVSLHTSLAEAIAVRDRLPAYQQPLVSMVRLPIAATREILRDMQAVRS